jgi:uncharacterized coiled-coil DUF342 family protein
VSAQEKINQIANLRSQIATLKDQVNKADSESKKQIEKRDQLNEQTKKANLEIRELKKQRDVINEKVKTLKQQRDDVRVKIKPILDEIQAINEKKEVLKKKAPRINQKDIQEEINAIDWKIQTESLDFQEEKRLVGEVKVLETQLISYKKIDKQNKKISEHMQERKTLGAQADVFHHELSELAKKSQELHENMIAKIAEAKKAKEEADAQHKGYIQNKEQIQTSLVDIAVLTGQMLGLQSSVREQNNALREKENAQRAQEREQISVERNKKQLNEHALKEKLGAQAKEKLQKGEKLSWNEFQLLAGDDDSEESDTQN